LKFSWVHIFLGYPVLGEDSILTFILHLTFTLSQFHKSSITLLQQGFLLALQTP